jgi:hypothetical protein
MRSERLSDWSDWCDWGDWCDLLFQEPEKMQAKMAGQATAAVGID